MKALSKKDELKVFEAAFELHKEDIELARRHRVYITGMCALLRSACIANEFMIGRNIYVSGNRNKLGEHLDYVDLKVLLPKFNELMGDFVLTSYKWKQQHHNRTRHNHFKRIIAELKQEIKEGKQ